MRLTALITALIFFSHIPLVHGQEAAQPNTPADFWNYDVKQKVPEKAPLLAPIEPSVTHHQISIKGQRLSYTTTADTLPIRNATTGITEGEIFYIYYTRDNSTAATNRPLIFAFNGGPGTATI